MQNDIVKRPEKVSSDLPAQVTQDKPPTEQPSAPVTPASADVKPATDIVSKTASVAKTPEPVTEHVLEADQTSDELKPEEAQINQPKKQKGNSIALVVFFAILVCLGLVGLAVYSQISAK